MQQTTPTETETAAATETIDPKRRYLCRHIFTEGHRCGSPALRGQDLCYNHSRSRREAPISGRSGTFPMPRIDDRASIQLALYEVLSRLSAGDIEYKRGSILLYGLQIASSNLPRHARTNATQQPQVEEVTTDYHLGDLAPITEIPDPAQAQEDSLAELERENPERARMKRWLASPRQPTPPASPANETAADLCALQPAVPVSPALPTESETPTEVAIETPTEVVIETPTELVILSAAKNPCIQPEAPRVSTSTPAGRPVLTPQPLTLAAVRASANPQPPTDNLQLPTPPRYTSYTHDSHSRMAP